MINICGSCEHKVLRRYEKCEDCSGNPKLVDNFKQRKPDDLSIGILSPNVQGERDERDKRRKVI